MEAPATGSASLKPSFRATLAWELLYPKDPGPTEPGSWSRQFPVNQAGLSGPVRAALRCGWRAGPGLRPCRGIAGRRRAGTEIEALRAILEPGPAATATSSPSLSTLLDTIPGRGSASCTFACHKRVDRLTGSVRISLDGRFLKTLQMTKTPAVTAHWPDRTTG